MAYTFEQSYYFRPYRGNSSFWLNRYGNGSIASHQKATLYTAAGSADQRLKVHKVSGGCQLLSDLNNAYGLNIYGTKAGSVCDFYPVSGNFNDALIDLLTVDAANNLYRIKMINHNLYLTPASNSSGAALTWENASNADNQIWQLCASQSSGGGSTGGSTTITMPVNANQNYSGNSSWIINYGCAVCCGVDLASWKKNKSYTISDFANYYDEANGYYWTGPDNFSCSDAISLASLNEAQTIEKIRSYVKNHIPVACHAVGSGSRQHWFVAYELTGESGGTWATAGIKVLDVGQFPWFEIRRLLSGNYCTLPARFSDAVACYTNIIIISPLRFAEMCKCGKGYNPNILISYFTHSRRYLDLADFGTDYVLNPTSGDWEQRYLLPPHVEPKKENDHDESEQQ